MSEIVLQQYDNNITQNNNPFYYHSDYVPGFIMHTQLSRDMLPSLEDNIYFDTCNDDEVIQIILERNGRSSNRRKELQGYLRKVTETLMIDTINTFDDSKMREVKRVGKYDDDDDGDDDDEDKIIRRRFEENSGVARKGKLG
jgi:hypothetical protein